MTTKKLNMTTPKSKHDRAQTTKQDHEKTKHDNAKK